MSKIVDIYNCDTTLPKVEHNTLIGYRYPVRVFFCSEEGKQADAKRLDFGGNKRIGRCKARERVIEYGRNKTADV